MNLMVPSFTNYNYHNHQHPNHNPNSNPDSNPKDQIQDMFIQVLNKTGCSLNLVNNYRENIVHLCASNDCNKIIMEILIQYGTEKSDMKNKFGWTPLMQAIREKHLSTVQLLINSGFQAFERSYLGMSTLGIATAAGAEMFDRIYKRYPSAIKSTATDDISPLCIAAMMNDKLLFFRILNHGAPLKIASEYTHFMMRQSVHKEIRKLAKPHLITENFWEDNSDNLEVCAKPNNLLLHSHFSFDFFNNKNLPQIQIQRSAEQTESSEVCNKKSQNVHELHINVNGCVQPNKESAISPNLAYNQTEKYCTSPKLWYDTNNRSGEHTGYGKQFLDALSMTRSEDKRNTSESRLSSKYEKIRPPNLKLIQLKNKEEEEVKEDLNMSLLGFTPNFAPVKSPNAPQNSDEEDDPFGDKTPTPPRCSTPPIGIVLSNSQNQLVRLLHAHHLDNHVAIFIEQEVDLELFSTLENEDLIAIGIESENERLKLLTLINMIKPVE